MTITALPSSSTPTTVGPTRPTRYALAVVAALGPACMAGWALTSPSGVSDAIPAAVAKIMAAPSSQELSLLLLFLAAIGGTVGVLVVGSVVRSGAPRFGAVATAIAFVGFFSAYYAGPVPAIAAAPAAGLDATQVLKLIAAIDAQPLGVLINVLFVCLPAGVLLLGVAALISARKHRCPWWVAVLLLASMPLIMIGGFLSMTAMAVGWLVAAAAFGAVGRVYARTGGQATM